MTAWDETRKNGRIREQLLQVGQAAGEGEARPEPPGEQRMYRQRIRVCRGDPGERVKVSGLDHGFGRRVAER